MTVQLSVEEFLKKSKDNLLLDVRSEGEFEYAHIPHAFNLPLFNNEERKTVGTTYKQNSRGEAILTGLDIVGTKMAGFVRTVKPLVKNNQVFIHCWRGGMRSGSMAWLMNLLGYDVYVLKGGYKAYRHHILNTFEEACNCVVLGGKTGCSKTEILKRLKDDGEQVLDLEQLANHKGSAFGALGQGKQPTTEYFENLIYEQLENFDKSKLIWAEDESRTIGRVIVNPFLWQRLRSAPLFVVELPLEARVKKLIADYGHYSKEELKKSFGNIVKKLGNEQWKNAIAAIEEDQLETATLIALGYYDKAYERGFAMKDTEQIFHFAFENDDIQEIVQTLKNAAHEKYGY